MIAYIILVIGDAEHVDSDSHEDDEGREEMNLEVLKVRAALPEKHVHRNEELKYCEQKPGRDLIRRPE